jgi:hypothetical protein
MIATAAVLWTYTGIVSEIVIIGHWISEQEVVAVVVGEKLPVARE